MAKHDYAGAMSVAPDMSGVVEVPVVRAYREPAPVLSLVAGLGHKLSKASRDRRIVSARRSTEAKAAETQSGDAIDRALMARIVARDAKAFAALSVPQPHWGWRTGSSATPPTRKTWCRKA